MRNKIYKMAGYVFLCDVLFFGNASATTIGPVDLSSHTIIDYDLGIQPEAANWVVSATGTAVNQTTNNKPSIFLLDSFDSGQSIIEFDFWVGDVDDDTVGFVWGYQGRGEFYVLSWAQESLQHGWGMGVYAVKPDPNNVYGLLGNWELLAGAGVSWDDRTAYHVYLDFGLTNPGEMTIVVSDDATFSQSFQIADDTYTSGAFGFHTWSQENVWFWDLTVTKQDNPIPEPATLALMGLGLAGISFARKKKQP